MSDDLRVGDTLHSCQVLSSKAYLISFSLLVCRENFGKGVLQWTIGGRDWSCQSFQPELSEYFLPITTVLLRHILYENLYSALTVAECG